MIFDDGWKDFLSFLPLFVDDREIDEDALFGVYELFFEGLVSLIVLGRGDADVWCFLCLLFVVI